MEKHFTCSGRLPATPSIDINAVFFDVLASSRSMASKTPVGFIGLGNMGNPMAKNLLKNGYPVIATDVFPESCKEVQELGAQVSQSALTPIPFVCFSPTFDDSLSLLQIVDNPADVAEKADRIITMLPSSPNVIEVYTGVNGILKCASYSAHTCTDYDCNMYG